MLEETIIFLLLMATSLKFVFAEGKILERREMQTIPISGVHWHEEASARCKYRMLLNSQKNHQWADGDCSQCYQ